MSGNFTLTNARYIDIFDEKLRACNNTFFKTLQDDDLLNETNDIKNSATALNIAGGSTYTTAQFNNFIRNIINFRIKNYTDLSTTGTNLEFVNKAAASSSSQYTFNDDIGNNIIDTLKILNVFVDILEAYKHCIDKDVTTINSGYFDDIEIDRIEVVSSGTRYYVSGSAVPDVNTYKNVGYIRNTKTSTDASAKNVLYLSVQSFYTGLTTANYNNIFDKTLISGSYTENVTYYDIITTQIFNVSDSANANPPLQGLELTKKDYARHYYDYSKSVISKTGLTKDDRNKNVVSLLLKCLFNIDPKFRKQSVYALYYYYKFVQLYATLIINVSNVMYAKGDNTTQTTAPCIDSYNTGDTYSITNIEVTIEGIGYTANNQNTLIIANGGGSGAAANATADATGGILVNSVKITNYGSGYTSAPNVNSDPSTPPTRKSNALAEAAGSVRKIYEDAATDSGTANANSTAADLVVQATANGFSGGDASIINGERTTALNNLINSSITGINKEIDISGNYIAYNGSTLTNASIIASAKGNGASQIPTGNSTFDTYISHLIDKRKKLLIKNKRAEMLVTAKSNYDTATGYATDRVAIYKSTIVPLAFKNISKAQDKNIDRLKEVIDDIEVKITSLITEIKSVAIDVNYEELVILTNNVDAKINKNSNNNVVIMIAATSSTSPNNVNNPIIYKWLKKYNENSSFKTDYSVYDKKNKIYYDIVSINDNLIDNSISYFAIEIKAVFVADTLKPEYKVFYRYDNTLYGQYSAASPTAFTTAGDFLQIKRKDINGFKDNYVESKKTIDTLNTNISLNTNRVNNQKNLYETQYNKNVFLSRQILTYNILICTIVVVLIGINVINMDKPLVKSISLACLGIIILLFVIYFMSNITYIETFVIDGSDIAKLKTDHVDKKTILENNIDKLNQQFIRYFEALIIILPTADSVDFYREITSVINADIENKTYLDKILDFNKSQGNTNMDTLKYELENNKLYILTLLISAIIFIGLYNIYINYIDNDKYLSLMIFIAIIIFIVIGAYYIINSNRRVRTIHKNIYWGPQSSENF